MEWLIITLEDEAYEEIAHLLREDIKHTTLGTELCMKLQSHLNTILQERSKYPRTHFSLGRIIGRTQWKNDPLEDTFPYSAEGLGCNAYIGSDIF